MRNSFTFSLPEQRGIFILIILCIVSLACRFWPFRYAGLPVELMFESSSVDRDRGYDSETEFKHTTTSTKEWDLHKFDPNYVKATDFRNMGFSNDFIKNYFVLKQNVGFITTKQEFLSLNLLSDTDLERVLPYLDFTRYAQPSRNQNESSKSNRLVNINSCDSIDLKGLTGIGNKLSKRIFNYRQSLGGFSNVAQLKEVYGVDSALYLKLVPYVITDGFCRKININEADEATLRSHPYIDFKIAQNLVRYRNQNGGFKQVVDLRQMHQIDTTWLSKIIPYLSVN
jgi:competence protein ComEA